MKKVFSLAIFLIFLCLLAFADTVEIDHLIFLPDSSNQFVKQAEAMNQLDTIAGFLKSRNLDPGQIKVYGYAADSPYGLEPMDLSRNRALFVINELQRRGVPENLFDKPIGYGSVDLWGSNVNEADKSPNRRARVMLDGDFLSPAAVQALPPPVTISSNDEPSIKYGEITVEKTNRFPSWILPILLALLIAIIYLMFRKKKKQVGETAPKIEPIPAPIAPIEKTYVLYDEEVRLYAYGLCERRNYQNGDAPGDWFQAECELTAYYENQGYRVLRNRE